MDNRNSAFASRQGRRSTDGPYGQEKGKEGKGKDGHTDKGKGKGPHWSGMWDRDGNRVYIFDSEQQMRDAGAELGIIRCGSSDSSSPSQLVTDLNITASVLIVGAKATSHRATKTTAQPFTSSRATNQPQPFTSP